MKKLFLLSGLLFLFFFVPLNVSADEISNLPTYETHPYSVTFHSEAINRYVTILSTKKIYVDDLMQLNTGASRRYFSVDGKSWRHEDSSPSDTKYSMPSPILLANHNIMKNGSVFFSPPRSYLITVGEMGQVSLGNLMTDFGTTLGTLLPVGLIISSMVLALYLVRRFLPSFGLSSK